VSGIASGAEHEQDGVSPQDGTLLCQWYEIHGSFRRLNNRLFDDVEAGTGLAPSAFQALGYLTGCSENTANMSQLSAYLGFSTAGTTKVADRLAEAGLIERTPSAVDRRVILVTLTPGGRQVAVEAIGTFLAALRTRVVEPLGDDGFAALVETMSGLDPEGRGGSGCGKDQSTRTSG